MGRWAQSIRRGSVGHGDTQNADPFPLPSLFTLAPIAGSDWLMTYQDGVAPQAPAGSDHVKFTTSLVSGTVQNTVNLNPIPGSVEYTPGVFAGGGTTVYVTAQWIDAADF